jgi:hypothetical protein
MPRRRFTIISALSLLLCLSMAALWVRSGWREDWVLMRTGRWRIDVGSDRGTVGAVWRTSSESKPPVTYQARRHAAEWRLSGFNAEADGQGGLIAFPHWLACLLLAAPAMLALRKRSTVPTHICPTCGYDLRATRDRCPECGTPADAGPCALEV